MHTSNQDLTAATRFVPAESRKKKAGSGQSGEWLLGLMMMLAMAFGTHASEKVLFNFESSDQLELWSYVQGAELYQQSVEAGQHAMGVRFPAWREGQPQWPMARYYSHDGALPSDFLEYQLFEFDIINPMDRELVFFFNLRNDNQMYQEGNLTVAPGERRTISVSTEAIYQAVGTSRIPLLQIGVARPNEAGSFVVDKIRLLRVEEVLDADKILFNFESSDQFSAWSFAQGAELYQQSVEAGQRAMGVRFPGWREGQPQWPMARYYSNDGVLSSDYLDYQLFAFDIINPMDRELVFFFNLRNDNQMYQEGNLTVAPGQRRTITVRTEAIHRAVNTNRIPLLQIGVARPDKAGSFIIDSIRLLRYGDLLDEARIDIQRGRSVLESIEIARADMTAGQANMVEQLRQHVDRLHSSIGTLDKGVSGQREQEALAAFHQSQDELLRLFGLAEVLQLSERVNRGEVPGSAGVALVPVTSMEKVFREVWRLDPAIPTDKSKVALARNEAESLQVVIAPTAENISNLTWELSDFYGPEGARLSAKVHMVAYVNTPQPVIPVYQRGWWPDILLPSNVTNRLNLGHVQPVWVTVKADGDQPAGLYTGTLIVRADELAEPIEINLTAHVHDFAIPEHSSLRTAFGLGPRMLSHSYPHRTIEMLRIYEDWLLDNYRMNPTVLYHSGQPLYWDAERIRELRAKGLNWLSIMFIGVPGAAGTSGVQDPNTVEAYRDWIEQLMTTTIAAYMPVIREAGAESISSFYSFDEVPLQYMQLAYDTAEKLKQYFPDIPILTTAFDPAFGMNDPRGQLIEGWVPTLQKFAANPDVVRRARMEGKQIWWYFANYTESAWAQGLPNLEIEYPAIDMRVLLGPLTAKYKPDGFLYYHLLGWLKHNKTGLLLSEGPLLEEWNPVGHATSIGVFNGCGSLIAPGIDGPLPTLRLENMRDGLEDYEYYLLAREHLKQRGEDVSLADVPSEVARSVDDFTRDPAIILAERQRLVNIILDNNNYERQ